MATRWGIVSTGLIASDFVAAMKCLPPGEHRLVAVAARSIEKAKEFAKKHGIEKAYGSYEDIAKDSDVEVVYIATINSCHKEVATLMLNSGKPCLLEKPLCMNVKETKEVVQLARDKKLFLMEAIWTRCFPLYGEMMKKIKSGEIGDVVWATANFGVPVHAVARASQKKLGGGATLDLGIYAVQFASLVMGSEKPTKVIAGGHTNNDGVDNIVGATLLYSGGRVATVSTSMLTTLPNEGIVCGTKGIIKVESPFWCPETMQSPSGVYSSKFTADKKNFIYDNSEGLKFEADEVRRCLKKGLTESPKVTLDETIIISEILEAMRKSAGVVYEQD